MMLTLSKVTKETKLFLKWGGIIIGGLLLFLLLLRVGTTIKNQLFPEPEAPPTVGFGKLKEISFPQSALSGEVNFTLDTVSGTLPSFDDRIKVYKIIKPEPNILALKRAQEKLAQAGFRSNPFALSDSLYQWTDSSEIGRKISFDIYSQNFSISSNFLNNKEVQNASKLGNENSAIATSEDFLSKIGLLPDDLDSSKTKTSLFRIENGQLIPATSLSNAQVIRVDFSQKDVDDFPILYPHHPLSIINFSIASARYDSQIISTNFSYNKRSDESHTYPIKTSSQAFEDLKKGKYYIISGKSRDVSIKNVFLAYYMPEEPKDYLLPIVVFEGDNNFLAYIEAVTDEWIEK